MKRRKLNSYRPDVKLHLCSQGKKVWYEVTTPGNQIISFPTLKLARADIKLWYGKGK